MALRRFTYDLLQRTVQYIVKRVNGGDGVEGIFTAYSKSQYSTLGQTC